MKDLLAVILQGGAIKGKTLGVIGITVSLSGHSIANVHPNTPAEAAGLLKGDKIVRSIDLEGRRDIDGPPFTKTAIIIKRGDGASPVVVLVERLPHQMIQNKEVRGYFKGREDFVIGDDD